MISLKKIVIASILVIVVLSLSVCFADTLISDVYFEVSDVVDGDARLAKSKGSSKGIKTLESGVNINGIIWTNMKTGSIMKDTDKYEEGIEYKLKLTFVARNGYEIGNLKATINGEKVAVDHNEAANRYEVEKIFKAIERPAAKTLKSVEFEIPEVEEGETYSDSYKVKTNLTGKFEKVKFNEDENGIEIRCSMASQKVYTSSFQINCSINLDELNDLYSPASVKFDDDLIIKVNGEEIEYRVSEEYDMITFIEWVDPIWTTSKIEHISNINLTIKAPKLGEKPSTAVEGSHENVHVNRVIWEPADETFAPGKEYTVKIYWGFEHKNNKYLAEELVTTINNMKAKYGYKEGNGGIRIDPYSEVTFPKLEGEAEEKPQEETKKETKKVVWEKASNWAAEELEKANEKELVPVIFEKEDLTKNITRREFAHVVVELYENLTGKNVSTTSQNPFADTNDEEVLKAYSLGITNGTSDTTFSPDNLITREQMATMMKRALEKAGIDTTVDLDKIEKFADDSDLHEWGKEAVYYMSSIEIIKGVGENKFGATGDASREQSLLISVRSSDKFAK